jgi:outer membrane receptor protein involved in Fe transport
VLKDGAAATYGSDAIAGVVNFITKKNFNGLEAGADYRFIDGSKGDYGLNVTYGKVWDKANILASIGWQHRSKLGVADRDWANKPYLTTRRRAGRRRAIPRPSSRRRPRPRASAIPAARPWAAMPASAA